MRSTISTFFVCATINIPSMNKARVANDYILTGEDPAIVIPVD